MRFWSLIFGLAALATIGVFAFAPFSADWWLPAGPDKSVSHLHSVSSAGKEIDSLFVIILVICGVTFIATHVALYYVMTRYAARGDADAGRKAVYSHGSKRLEIGLAIGPTIALVFIALYQMGTWASVKFHSGAPKTSPLAEVTGRQFQWLVRYPGPDDVLGNGDDLHAINDLHFIKGESALIHLKAADVLHSFFLPQLRIKQDAVPGQTIPVWFDADQAGHYELVCAELCGWGHTTMRANVTVHETRSDFDAWMRSALADQARDQAPPAAAPAPAPNAASGRR